MVVWNFTTSVYLKSLFGVPVHVLSTVCMRLRSSAASTNGPVVSVDEGAARQDEI